MAEHASGAAPREAPSIHLLDGPYVRELGRRLAVPEGSGRLLVYVALRNGRAVTRQRIAGTLWPEVGEDRAAGNLRTALWRLRAAGIHVLAEGGHGLAVAAGVAIDVFDANAWAGRVVSGTARQGDLDLARLHPAALDLLPDWYDDWLVLERERLRQWMLHALEELSRELVARGRYCEAIEAAITAIDVDPLRESAQRALIAAHLAEGNVGEARRVYAAFARLLESELGVAPSPATTALVGSPLPLAG
ncbi:AfsR/SARP family transcriptional regulator [Demequina iriomotensis]|uniref:AfsR/SARP family transcriptional regulator n=1 Tax=Demequina iriomotensis TaxID=1536641 RepID=UPI000783E5EA|nr:BTAD domain-containing putative transcriptional regulator [Demequina iriomotensis]